MSLGQSGVFRVEEIASGVELVRREFPRDGTGSLVLSPDGKLVAIWTGAEYPEALPVGLAGMPANLGS